MATDWEAKIARVFGTETYGTYQVMRILREFQEEAATAVQEVDYGGDHDDDYWIGFNVAIQAGVKAIRSLLPPKKESPNG